MLYLGKAGTKQFLENTCKSGVVSSHSAFFALVTKQVEYMLNAARYSETQLTKCVCINISNPLQECDVVFF